MRVALAPVIAVLAVGLAAGCGSDDEATADGATASFVGVPWVLQSGLDVAGWESARPSATFENGTVGGSTGCNRFTGAYTIDGDSLELGPLASTKIACPPPADDVERAYLAALERVAGWRTDDDGLILLDADGAELLRYRAATPDGDWTATAIQTGTALVSPLPGTSITARFDTSGTLTGSAGCNTYRTTFATDGGGIEIAPPAATEKACPEPGVMEQEAAYLAALPSAVHFRVDGGSLALLAADGTYVASFAPERP